MVTWLKLQKESLQHLLELSDCSNFELGWSAWLLGLLPSDTITADNIHYQIREVLRLREDCPTHYKHGIAQSRYVNLSSCRLGSSARLQFSVRLIPVSYFRRVEGKLVRYYGVLGVIQELCSRLLRVAFLGAERNTAGLSSETPPESQLWGAEHPSDVYGLNESVVVDFLAQNLVLPNLKIAAIHFPQWSYLPAGNEPRIAKQPNLIAAFLGEPQHPRNKDALQAAFTAFSKKVIDSADWGYFHEKLEPSPSVFRLTMPPLRKLEKKPKKILKPEKPARPEDVPILDLRNPCGHQWSVDTLNREIRRRVDRHNSYFDAESGHVSPMTRLWMANVRYYKTHYSDARQQQALFGRLYKRLRYYPAQPREREAALIDAMRRVL